MIIVIHLPDRAKDVSSAATTRNHNRVVLKRPNPHLPGCPTVRFNSSQDCPQSSSKINDRFSLSFLNEPLRTRAQKAFSGDGLELSLLRVDGIFCYGVPLVDEIANTAAVPLATFPSLYRSGKREEEAVVKGSTKAGGD